MFVGIANKFATLPNSIGVRCVVGPRNRYGEYVVGVYHNNMLYRPAMYYTTDLNDAISAALDMTKELHS